MFKLEDLVKSKDNVKWGLARDGFWDGVELTKGVFVISKTSLFSFSTFPILLFFFFKVCSLNCRLHLYLKRKFYETETVIQRLNDAFWVFR